MLSYSQDVKDIKNEELNFTFYARFIPFVFSVGLFIVFIISYLSIKGLKDDFDGSFPEPLSELSLLNDFQSQYMLETIDILQHNTKSDNPHKSSFYQWNLYKSFAKSLMEQSSIFSFLRNIYQTTFLTKQHNMILTYQDRKQKLINELEKTIKFESIDISHLSKETLYENARKVNNISAEIIDTQVAIHMIEKDITDYLHNATICLLCIMTFFIFCIIIYIDIIVIGFIRRLNQILLNKFLSATADLRNLNSHLQNEIAKNVEDLRRKDIAMYAQSKLAAVGEMVQNMAHQWRNPLNALTLVIQDIQHKFNKNILTKEALDKHTKTALTLADNMSNTIENFYNFFRLNSNFEYFDVKEVIYESIVIYEPLFQSLNIQTHIEYNTKNDYSTFGNKHALVQVILVLLGNIKDVFMERKIKNPHCFISMTTKDSVLYIHIYDNAGGINDDNIHKIFNLYFTTKKIGTGIGLYMAKEMLTKYLQGNINAKNITFNCDGEYCQGALFMLELQLINETRQ